LTYPNGSAIIPVRHNQTEVLNLEREGEVNNLRKRRKELGLTQLEVAIKAKIKESQYQRYEYGDREPGVRTANRIAKALKSTTFKLYPPED